MMPESLLKKLDEVKTIYLRQLYFWSGTKDKLPSELQQKILKLMDPLGARESETKFW
jgi:hypothetical protein